jgi:hypothetical protein
MMRDKERRGRAIPLNGRPNVSSVAGTHWCSAVSRFYCDTGMSWVIPQIVHVAAK